MAPAFFPYAFTEPCSEKPLEDFLHQILSRDQVACAMIGVRKLVDARVAEARDRDKTTKKEPAGVQRFKVFPYLERKDLEAALNAWSSALPASARIMDVLQITDNAFLVTTVWYEIDKED